MIFLQIHDFLRMFLFHQLHWGLVASALWLGWDLGPRSNDFEQSMRLWSNRFVLQPARSTELFFMFDSLLHRNSTGLRCSIGNDNIFTQINFVPLVPLEPMAS